MDSKALWKLSYGVFLLATKVNGKANACITNTCMQVASTPTRVAISVLNSNLTCEMIKESGVFALSILDQSCTFPTIKHFGMQSGKNVDKFADIELPEDCNGMPYLGWGACALLSCKVVAVNDLESHTVFIAEVVDSSVLSTKEPMTYAYYQSTVKPKPEKPVATKKIVAWRCKICGYVYEDSNLPSDFVCLLCGHPAEDFEPIYED